MNIQTPLISVLMPVRTINDDRHRIWLYESISSILQQRETNLELIIIADIDVAHSSLGLPASFHSDHRLRIINRPAPGIVNALNCGLQTSKGNYIARMDADDIAHPDRLNLQLQYLLRHERTDIISCGVEIFSKSKGDSYRSGEFFQPESWNFERGDFSSEGVGTGSKIYQDWLNSLGSHESIKDALFIESPLPHPTWFARRTLFEQLGGYHNTPWAEDYDLLLRAWQEGARMAKLKQRLVFWREHKTRLTRTDERYSKAQFIEAKVNALSKTLNQNRNIIILGTGSNAVMFHDALKRYKIKVDFFVDVKPLDNNRRKRQISVIDYERLRSIRNQNHALIVSIITRRGAREKLRDWFDEHNYIIGKDYIFAG